MKRALEEACSFPWNHIDANMYDQVLNWYVSTCDPLFILQPYMDRGDAETCSNDALVFRLVPFSSTPLPGPRIFGFTSAPVASDLRPGSLKPPPVPKRFYWLLAPMIESNISNKAKAQGQQNEKNDINEEKIY